MKLMERMQQKRVRNKGFSLVELIIVIAIMAILIGIVGTQVVPYLRRAREERDMQIIDAFSTAAVTFYSLNSDKFANQEQAGGTVVIGWTIGGDVDIKAAGGNTTVILTEDEWLAGMKELTGYENTKDDLKNLKDAMSSAEGKTITKIVTKYNFGTSSNNETQLGPEVPAGAVGVQACKGDNFHDNKILEVSTSYIGSKQ